MSSSRFSTIKSSPISERKVRNWGKLFTHTSTTNQQYMVACVELKVCKHHSKPICHNASVKQKQSKVALQLHTFKHILSEQKTAQTQQILWRRSIQKKLLLWNLHVSSLTQECVCRNNETTAQWKKKVKCAETWGSTLKRKWFRVPV